MNTIAVRNPSSVTRTRQDLKVSFNDAGRDVRGMDLQAWLTEADLNWQAKHGVINYTPDGFEREKAFTVEDRKVVYRSDTGLDLGVTGNHFKFFQPEQVGSFFQDLVDRHGFEMDRAQAFKGGRVIYARAKVGRTLRIHGNDIVEGNAQLVTSFDGSLATMIRFGTLRLICLNGMSVGVDIVPVVRVSHRSIVNPTEVKIKLGLDGVFETFEERADRMASTPVTHAQAISFFLDVYHSMKAEEIVAKQAEKQTDKTIARLAQHFIASPGSQLPSAKGTVWGLLNAVTYDVDHAINARNEESRQFSSLFGAGEKLKNKAAEIAWDMARAA